MIGVGSITGWKYSEQQRKQNAFVTCKLTAKQPVSSTASIFYLSPSRPLGDVETRSQVWKTGIWNFDFKQPQIQIVRAYTPLPPTGEEPESKSSDLRFLIRHDPHGEVSSYLHRLPVGSDIEVRGPNVEYVLPPNIKQVLFFAGGTGIAPALQIAHAMFDEQSKSEPSELPSEKKKLHIYWANRRREDCEGGISDTSNTGSVQGRTSFGALLSKVKPKVVQPSHQEPGVIVRELELLKKKYPGQITVEYFVNAEGTWIDEDVVYNSLSRFDDKDFSKASPSSSEQRQIIISGPSGFITHLAGPKEWKNGREEQGHVSKMIAHAISQNPHHVKVWKV